MTDLKKKLNIAMVCDPISNVKSGSVVATIRFARLLKERGHNIIFIGSRTKHHRTNDYLDGIKTYRFRGTTYPKACGYYLAFPTVRELKKVFQDEKIDVVYIVLPMSGSIVAIKAAQQLGIRIVAHSHSQPENIFMDMPKMLRPFLDDVWNRYLGWIYRKAQFLIYPSEFGRSLLQKFNNKDQSSAVISNGINLGEFKPSDIGDFNSRYNIPEGKIKLLFVGRLNPEKSVDTLIRAVPYIIARHPDTHLMLVGDGHMRSKLENLVRDLKVEKYITFLGSVSDQDKIHAYNACDIFVLPSLAELEGMVVLEAMACGKPIIISDAEMSASRYFVNGNGFLFKALDPKDLAEQALKLITNAKLREEFAHASLRNIQHYDIGHSVDLLEDVYYSVLRPTTK